MNRNPTRIGQGRGRLGQGGKRPGGAFPVEEFVQALSAQLDRAQDALALKARTGRPLTFALRDLSVELKVFWEAQPDGRMLLRHAAPNEAGASTVNFSFTTITRAMVEENTFAFDVEDDPRSLEDIGGGTLLDAEDRRKLELAGVRTAGQLRRVSENTDAARVGVMLDIPVNRLRRLLTQSARPAVLSTEPLRQPGDRDLLLIRGANLEGVDRPRVLLAGEPVEVLESTRTQILVRPMSHHLEGELEIQIDDDSASGFFAIPGGDRAAASDRPEEAAQ